MKSFNCPQCGPVMFIRVHGDWVLPELKDTAFIVSRKDTEVFDAKITEETKVTIVDRLQIPRYLAAAESYVEDHRRGICLKCNEMVTIPRPKPVIDPAIAQAVAQANNTVQSFFGGMQTTAMPGGPPTSMPMQNVGPSPLVIGMLDAALTEQNLDDIITDIGENPSAFNDKAEKLQWLIDRLY